MMNTTDRSIESNRKKEEFDTDGNKIEKVDNFDDLDTRLPTEVDTDEWVCDICNDYSCDKGKYNSMRMHVLKKHPDDYRNWVSEYGHLAPESGKKTKTKPRVARDSSAVKLEPVTAVFDPAEEQEIAQLRKETAILRERLAQKGIVDKLGIPEAEEAQQRALFEEDQIKENLQSQMFRMQREEIKQLREDNKENLKFRLEMLKSNNTTQVEILKSQHKMELSVEKIKAENAQQMAELSQNNRDYQQWAMRTGDKFLDYKFREFKEETSPKALPQKSPAGDDDIYSQLENIDTKDDEDYV